MSKGKEKKKSKWKYPVPFDFIIAEINSCPAKRLLPVAKIVCGGDFAVYDYNKKGPFYHNIEALRHAMRRCVSINAFDHCATVIRMLDLEAKYAEKLAEEKDRENNR